MREERSETSRDRAEEVSRQVGGTAGATRLPCKGGGRLCG